MIDYAQPRRSTECEPRVQLRVAFTQPCVHGLNILRLALVKSRKALLQLLRHFFVLESPLTPVKGVRDDDHKSTAHEFVGIRTAAVVLFAKLLERDVLAVEPDQFLFAVIKPAAVIV